MPEFSLREEFNRFRSDGALAMEERDAAERFEPGCD